MTRQPKDGEQAVVWTKNNWTFIGTYDADCGGWNERDGKGFWSNAATTSWTSLADAKAAPQMREALEKITENIPWLHVCCQAVECEGCNDRAKIARTALTP